MVYRQKVSRPCSSLALDVEAKSYVSEPVGLVGCLTKALCCKLTHQMPDLHGWKPLFHG